MRTPGAVSGATPCMRTQLLVTTSAETLLPDNVTFTGTGSRCGRDLTSPGPKFLLPSEQSWAQATGAAPFTLLPIFGKAGPASGAGDTGEQRKPSGSEDWPGTCPCCPPLSGLLPDHCWSCSKTQLREPLR